MGATGSAIVDFGAFPGSAQANVVVTGQASIVSGSKAEAWLDPTATATADHSQDEHIVIDLDVRCAALVAGTGFTIWATSRSGLTYGQFNVSWVWV